MGHDSSFNESTYSGYVAIISMALVHMTLSIQILPYSSFLDSPNFNAQYERGWGPYLFSHTISFFYTFHDYRILA